LNPGPPFEATTKEEKGDGRERRQVLYVFEVFILEGMGVGGRPKLDGHYGDAIIEVDPKGEIVKQWNAYGHVSPEDDPTFSLCPGAEWTHANCVEMTADGSVLVSFCTTTN